MKLVPFEIAKKLDDKGFDKPTLLVYDNNGIISEVLPDVATTSKNTFYRAPNVYEVMEWLRTEKKIYVYPHYLPNNNEWMCFVYDVAKQRMLTVNGYDDYEQAAIAGINHLINNLLI